MATTITRLMLTAALLYFVYQHAHWSVTVIVTLLAINNELTGVITGNLRKRIERLEAQPHGDGH